MKHFLSVFLFINLFASTAKAQYVTIPDPTLRDYLQMILPNCFNGSGMMDTTHTDVVDRTSLEFSYLFQPVLNWDGFQYFKNLQELTFAVSTLPPALPATLRKLSTEGGGGIYPPLPTGLTYLAIKNNTVITALPALPNSLTYLDCSHSYFLTSLGTLPAFLKYIDCSELDRLTSLPALPGSLDTLICHDDSLSVLPALPASLKYLDCRYNVLTSLPALSAQLRYLDAAGNYYITGISSLIFPPQLEYLNLTSAGPAASITALPSTLKSLGVGSLGLTSLPALPSTLQQLGCNSNLLTSIPTLPAGLITLSCDQNALTSLPAIPAGVTSLSCNQNQITVMPALPPVLNYFFCFSNHLTSLPALPNTITWIFCGDNQLVSLPALPTSLYRLYCSNNLLTSLPPLPANLDILECDRNQLYFLPELPPLLTQLKCQGNNLTCLPVLPVSPMSYGLNIDMDNTITCLPNTSNTFFVSTWDTDLMNVTYYSNSQFPLCSPLNNVNHCDAFPVMAGHVFNDNNNNSVRDANEPYRHHVKIELSNGAFTFTNINGYYELPAPDTGAYTITVTPPNYFTSVPLQYTYHFNSFDTIVTNDFALQATASIDSLSIGITNINFARPGFSFPCVIAYSNDGTTTLSPNIVFNYDNIRLIYDSSSNAAVINSGNSLTLSEPGFVVGDQKSFTAYFRVNPAAVIGDSVRVYANINGGAASASDSLVVGIRGSFDPNDKEATPTLSPEQVAHGDHIYYTIRFQNTGTDTAFNVVISDTLSSLLQEGSLEMINTSHPCKTTVKDNVVYFEFINILLPDSNINELKSHGYVNFRIKPQSNLVINNTIPNFAAIYFDYNSPVITNTAVTTIANPTTVPLKLLSFTVHKGMGSTANVYWHTSNEINVNGYNIEMSTDGRNYKSIAFEKARGDQYDSYTRSVAIPNNDVLYFRLKMMDNDGYYSYSNIAVLKNDKANAAFSFLNNPIKNELNISVNNAELKNSVAKIYNAQGGLVKTILLQYDVETIDTKSLPAGTYYFVTVKGSKQFVVIK